MRFLLVLLCWGIESIIAGCWNSKMRTVGERAKPMDDTWICPVLIEAFMSNHPHIKSRQSSFSGKHFVGIAGIKIWLPSWFLFHQASLDFVMIWVLWLHPSFSFNNSITVTLLSLSNKKDLFRNFLPKTFCIWVDFGSLKAVQVQRLANSTRGVATIAPMKSYDRARAKVGKGERIGGLEGDLSEDEMFMYSYCVVSKMYNMYIHMYI